MNLGQDTGCPMIFLSPSSKFCDSNRLDRIHFLAVLSSSPFVCHRIILILTLLNNQVKRRRNFFMFHLPEGDSRIHFSNDVAFI
jgi:hypothetical protein